MDLILTRMQRLYLRILVGSFRMMEGQLEQIPSEIRMRIGLPGAAMMEAWRGATMHALETATAADEPDAVRPSITDNAPVPAASA